MMASVTSGVTLTDLLPLFPALILVATGLAVLLLTAFTRRGAATPPFVILSVTGMVAALVAALLVPTHDAHCCGCAFPAGIAAAIASDRFARFFSVLVLLSGVGAVLLSAGYGPKSETSRGEHHALTLFALSGLVGLTTAVDLVALFIALEIASVSLYALAGLRRQSPASQEAALKYFVTGAFSSAFLLYGIALLYGVTGTTSLTRLASLVSSPVGERATLVVAVGLILVGLAFKAAIVPFHMWAPDVYEGAPTTTTALMAAGVKAAAFAALLRVLLFGLGPLAEDWRRAVVILALLTMVLGNLGALAQTSVKRMLAYSSIAHAGYALTGLVAVPKIAAESVAFYLIGYAAVSVGAFGLLAALARRDREPVTLDDLAGLGTRHPALAAAMTVFMISLTGVPLTAGFVGKLQVFRAAVIHGWTVLALVGFVMSVVSAYYYLRVVVAMYMREAADEDVWGAVDLPARLVLGAAAAVTLWIGVYPAPALAWAHAAASLFG